MASASRPQFSGRLGFVMAAAGSAVGLGNIWGFPTQTAGNGGGAFVVVYCVLVFLLAYPALMAELIIGRYRRANIVTALGGMGSHALVRRFGKGVGLYGVLTASLILAFYSLVGGWMLAHTLQPAFALIRADSGATWLTTQTPWRDIIFSGLFAGLTAAIVSAGVKQGIERWARRLMPLLITLMLLLALYVWSLEGAETGLKMLLLPDPSGLTNPSLLISAMGQAFFSLSLGVGTMLIYGSYLSPDDSLPATGAIVAGVDTGIALLAGLLIIPAIFAAQHLGIVIYGEDGTLHSGPKLIFNTLPALFSSIGNTGLALAAIFFALLSIAALTSSISMLEVPVAYLEESLSLSRKRAVAIAGSVIFSASILIALYFDQLFGFVVTFTTQYNQAILGIVLCLFSGWLLHREHLLKVLGKKEYRLFNTIWPVYVRFVCPLLIALIFVHSLRG